MKCSKSSYVYSKLLKLQTAHLFVLCLSTLLLLGLATLSAQESGGEEVVELETYEVSGFKEGLAKAMQEQRESVNIKDVISADTVGQLPDSNVAEALQRLPSLYLRDDQGEGRYVSIRGVDPILNNVTMNGQTIASSDTDGREGRAAPLDVLSAASASSIEVIKAVTPDMDGQSIGGTINIKTPSGFDRDGTFVYGSGEVGFNDFCTECDNYKFSVNFGTQFGREKRIGLFMGANYSHRQYASNLFEGQDYLTLGPNGTDGDYRAYNPDFDGILGYNMDDEPVTLDADGQIKQETDPADQVSGPDTGLNQYGDIVFMEGIAAGSAEGERTRKGFNGQLEYKNEKTHLWIRGYWTDYTDVERRPELRFRFRDYDAPGEYAVDPESEEVIYDDNGNPVLAAGGDGGEFRMTSPTTGFLTRARVEDETRYERQERPVWQMVIGGKQQIGDAWTVDGNFNYSKAKEDNPFLFYLENKSMTCENRRNDLGPIPENACFEFDFSNPTSPVVRLGPSVNAEYDGRSWPGEGGVSDLEWHTLSRIRNEISEVGETTWTADLNLRWDGQLFGHNSFIKTGFKHLDRDKFVNDSSLRYDYVGPDKTFADPGGDGSDGTLGIQHSNYSNLLGRYVLGGPNNDLYASYLGPTANIPAFLNEFHTYIGTDVDTQWIPEENNLDPNTLILRPDLYEFDTGGSRSNSVEDDYSMNEQITAWYGMAQMNIGEQFQVTGGVRIEWTDASLSAYNIENGDLSPVGVDVSYSNVLPNISFVWDPTDKIQVRGSVTKTIGRPDYPDMNPIGEFEYEEVEGLEGEGVYSGGLGQGNPELQPYEGLNYDVSVRYYLANGTGMISAGYFYKDIKNAIYDYSFSATDGNAGDDIDIGEPITPTTMTVDGDVIDGVMFRDIFFENFSVSTKNNSPGGFIEGVEITYQQNFTFLPRPLDGFGIVANMTWISSGVEVFQRPGEDLPYFRQPAEVFNASFFYQKKGFEARLAWHYQGDALGAGASPGVGGDAVGDVYERHRETMDAKISYRFNDRFSIYLAAKNLTDEPLRTWAGGSPDRIGDNPGFENYGVTYTIGGTWRFGR